jgi:hypothetical protein
VETGHSFQADMLLLIVLIFNRKHHPTCVPHSQWPHFPFRPVFFHASDNTVPFVEKILPRKKLSGTNRTGQCHSLLRKWAGKCPSCAANQAGLLEWIRLLMWAPSKNRGTVAPRTTFVNTHQHWAGNQWSSPGYRVQTNHLTFDLFRFSSHQRPHWSGSCVYSVHVIFDLMDGPKQLLVPYSFEFSAISH